MLMAVSYTHLDVYKRQAEGGETIFPTFFPSEVGVVGVKLELYFVLQAIEHCMEHIGCLLYTSGGRRCSG